MTIEDKDLIEIKESFRVLFERDNARMLHGNYRVTERQFKENAKINNAAKKLGIR